MAQSAGGAPLDPSQLMSVGSVASEATGPMTVKSVAAMVVAVVVAEVVEEGVATAHEVTAAAVPLLAATEEAVAVPVTVLMVVMDALVSFAKVAVSSATRRATSSATAQIFAEEDPDAITTAEVVTVGTTTGVRLLEADPLLTTVATVAMTCHACAPHPGVTSRARLLSAAMIQGRHLMMVAGIAAPQNVSRAATDSPMANCEGLA